MVQCARPGARTGVGAPVPGRQRETCGSRLLWVLGLVAFGLLLASCAPERQQDSLKPAGPYAQEIRRPLRPGVLGRRRRLRDRRGRHRPHRVRYRHRKGRDRMPPQTHGNTRLEIGWTILPAVVLAVVTVPTVATIWDLARRPPPDALHITVEGLPVVVGVRVHRRRHDDRRTTTQPITIADVMVIPTGPRRSTSSSRPRAG